MFAQRMEKLRHALTANNIDTALITDDVAEYEVALATSAAGTR